jgi:hypothetical protein
MPSQNAADQTVGGLGHHHRQDDSTRAGFQSWNAYWRSVGVSEADLDDARDAADSLVDPQGSGPRIWFQRVPEPKVVKNRLHLDLQVSGGPRCPACAT